MLTDELTAELAEYCQEYSAGQIDKEELYLKLQLLKGRIESLVIDYSQPPLDRLLVGGNNKLLDQLLRKTQYKALTALEALQAANNKRQFNSIVRHLMANKMYFKSLEKTIRKSMWAYVERNKLRHVSTELEIFTVKEIAKYE